MNDAYRALLRALATDNEAIVDAVVADVSMPGDDAAAVEALVRPAVDSLVAALVRGPALPGADLERLRGEGATAARRGEGVAAPIDRYLSTGWAIWDVATRHPAADPESLAALGAALLRAGDAAAAAIAEGHGRAERELASRTAAARRAFAADLLDLAPGDRDGLARLTRRAIGLGLDPGASHAVVVAWLGRDLEDVGPVAEHVERALVRPRRALVRPGRGPAGLGPDVGVAHPGGSAPASVSSAEPIVAARRGRLVLVLPDSSGRSASLVELLVELAEGEAWAAVRGPVAHGLEPVAATVGEALAALSIVERIGPAGTIVDAGDVALERALLADPVRLAAAVERELGPLLHAPRVGRELVDTVAAHLASRQNVRATARILGVAPRTVTYRLRRIESLLGRRLDGPTLRRLATALLARDLLETTT